MKLTLPVVVLLLAAGCAGSSSDGTKGAAGRKSSQVETSKSSKAAMKHTKYTRQEMRWLKNLVKWERNYSAASMKADDAYWDFMDGKTGLVAFRRALRPLRNCARSLNAKLGQPPGDRLQRAFELLLRACEQERQLAVAKGRMYSRTGKQKPVSDQAAKNSEKLVQRAQQNIRLGLLANRPLPVAGGMATKSRIEPRLSRAAGRLALRRIEVRCWAARDWKATISEYEAYTGTKAEIAGFANPATRVNIHPNSCADLARFTYRRWRPTSGIDLGKAADAVELLAHETEHLVNQGGSEAETECHAVQDVRRLARFLGASPSYSDLLATVYWKALYPTNPRDYRTPECRNGGLFDLNSQTDVWP